MLTTSEHDLSAVKEQLNRLLAHNLFSKSRRTPAFLRYVVEKTLEGKADELKERTIGIEAFGRTPDYDLAADPIVRITAAETRKRLAQYYVQLARTDELRIDVAPGSYVPTFGLERVKEPTFSELSTGPVAKATSKTVRARGATQLPKTTWAMAAGAFLVVVAIFGIHRLYGSPSLSLQPQPIDALRTFWAAEFGSTHPVLFCVSNDGFSKAGLNAADPSDRRIALDTGIALMRIAATLNREDRPYTVMPSSNVTFTELRTGPFVLVGASDNSWSQRLSQALPFSFQRTPSGEVYILDNKGSDHTRWDLQPGVAEFGILARVRDPLTQQAEIMIAGLTPAGTEAASGFLATPTQVSRLMADAPKDWSKGNFEAVVRMAIVNGVPGAPTVVRTTYWPSIFKN